MLFQPFKLESQLQAFKSLDCWKQHFCKIGISCNIRLTFRRLIAWSWLLWQRRSVELRDQNYEFHFATTLVWEKHLISCVRCVSLKAMRTLFDKLLQETCALHVKLMWQRWYYRRTRFISLQAKVEGSTSWTMFRTGSYDRKSQNKSNWLTEYSLLNGSARP